MNASLKLVAAAASEWNKVSLSQPLASDVVLELYDRERAALERYLCLIGTDSEASRDIVHDVFLKLHQHLMRGGERTNLRAWIYRVAHNDAQNRRRSPAVSRSDDLDAALASVESADSPEEALLGREREQRIQAAVRQLTSLQRQCLGLRAQGFRYREIGEVLQLSTSTVAETIQRAIGKVREKL